jgi:hypothetical protein
MTECSPEFLSLISSAPKVDHGCPKCGSILEPEFWEDIDKGAKLVPTEKSYKTYVKNYNPLSGKLACLTSSNSAFGNSQILTPDIAATISWEPNQNPNELLGKHVRVSIHPAYIRKPFYFWHLSEEGKDKFRRFLKENRFSLDYPNYFPVTPFFL